MEHIRVLLIEDNPDDAFLIKRMLLDEKEISFGVELEDRLSKGIGRLDEGFDVILLNLMLPDSKGVNTFYSMEKNAPQTPIIIITDRPGEGLAMRAVRSGAQDYMIKGQIVGSCLIHSLRFAIAQHQGRMQAFTHQELRAFDGKRGPSYVAYKGKVYDASGSTLWANGEHSRTHFSGHDLTDELAEAPHGEEVLARLTVAGELVREKSLAEKMLSTTEAHRPHPIFVHFPIAYSTAASLFVLLYVFSGYLLFEKISFYMLILDTISMPFAALSGLFSWKFTYHGESSRIFTAKIILSCVMALTVGAAFLWRYYNPTLLTAVTGPNYIFMFLVLILTPLV
ncbi:MAG: response regulator, partial [Deltaproteobacteria bacterium]